MNNTATAALRELAQRWGITNTDLNQYKATGKIINIPIPEFISDLTAHINEHYYPKAFIGWLLGHRLPIIEIDGRKFSPPLTTEQAFEWWKENVVNDKTKDNERSDH